MCKKPKLIIDWCTHQAAKFAVINWHYSKTMPVGKLNKIGVWEDGNYIGCVLFGRGANPNLSKSYNLQQTEVCELVRIALNKHITPVTRIVSEAIELFRKQNPSMKLIVSFADQNHGHLGIIYQAGNWIYTGLGKTTLQYFMKGRWVHKRTAAANGHPEIYNKYLTRQGLDKFRYVMPLNKKIRREIIKKSKPYPKKICPKGVTGSTPGFQPEGIGSSPISGLGVYHDQNPKIRT